MSIEFINYILAIGTVALQLATAGLLVAYVLRSQTIFSGLAGFLRAWGLWLALLLAFSASALTLVYSEVFGFPPCPLCWWQRVFLYPQVVLFTLALWKREFVVADYSIAFSIFGLGFALYHHALQVLPSGSLPCPAEGVVSCAQRFIFEFGYVTFPLMAATVFGLLIVLMLFVYERR